MIATSGLKATVMVSIGLMCNAAMLIQAHTLSHGLGDAAVKHLSPAEIESTSKILLGPLGLPDRPGNIGVCAQAFRRRKSKRSKRLSS